MPELIFIHTYISNNWCFVAVSNLFRNTLIIITCDQNKNTKNSLSIFFFCRFKTKVVPMFSNICYQPCNRRERIFILCLHSKLTATVINPLYATGLFLYPLKNIRKPMVFWWGYKRDQWNEMGFLGRLGTNPSIKIFLCIHLVWDFFLLKTLQFGKIQTKSL